MPRGGFGRPSSLENMERFKSKLIGGMGENEFCLKTCKCQSTSCCFRSTCLKTRYRIVNVPRMFRTNGKEVMQFEDSIQKSNLEQITNVIISHNCLMFPQLHIVLAEKSEYPSMRGNSYMGFSKRRIKPGEISDDLYIRLPYQLMKIPKPILLDCCTDRAHGADELILIESGIASLNTLMRDLNNITSEGMSWATNIW
jgi:hypothetical protein